MAEQNPAKYLSPCFAIFLPKFSTCFFQKFSEGTPVCQFCPNQIFPYRFGPDRQFSHRNYFTSNFLIHQPSCQRGCDLGAYLAVRHAGGVPPRCEWGSCPALETQSCAALRFFIYFFVICHFLLLFEIQDTSEIFRIPLLVGCSFRRFQRQSASRNTVLRFFKGIMQGLVGISIKICT